MFIKFTHFYIIIYFLIKYSECFRSRARSAPSSNYQVKFVSVIFRHGDRTPIHLYPNDPIAHNNFYPAGLGQLTNTGKVREYELGSHLRYLYNDFLGNTYMPNVVNARTTDYDRTKMSLMLVLSALYPPKGKQVWNRRLNWQPIPFTYIPRQQDALLRPQNCLSKYIEELKRVENSEEVKSKVEKFYPLMKNLTEWTGESVESMSNILRLYHTLKAEHSMGLELPKWAQNFFVHDRQLWDAAILQYQITNYNTNLRRLFGGVLLKNIINTINNITNNNVKHDERKIELYSGHETNVAAFLSTLGLYKPHVPEYSSAVIVELLQNRNNEYYISIRHYLGIPSESKFLQIPGCPMMPCPLNKFIELTKDVIPTKDDMKNINDHHRTIHHHS